MTRRSGAANSFRPRLSACQGILHQHQERFLAARPALWNHHPHRASGHFLGAGEISGSGGPENGNLNRSLKLARTPHKYPAPADASQTPESRRRANLLKRRHALFAGSRRSQFPARIQGNQIHLAAQPAQQFRNFLRILWFIVHPAEQYVRR